MQTSSDVGRRKPSRRSRSHNGRRWKRSVDPEALPSPPPPDDDDTIPTLHPETAKAIDIAWRSLIQGERHTTLSLLLHRQYLYLLELGAASGLVAIRSRKDWELSSLEAMDLSQTTKALCIRRFHVTRGPERSLTLRQIMTTIASHDDLCQSAGLEMNEADDLMNKTHDIANAALCVLGARNLDAHRKDIVASPGHAIQLAGAILRITELIQRPATIEAEAVALLRSEAMRAVKAANENPSNGVGHGNGNPTLPEIKEREPRRPIDRIMMGGWRDGFGDVERSEQTSQASISAFNPKITSHTQSDQTLELRSEVREQLLALRDKIGREHTRTTGEHLAPWHNVLQTSHIDRMLERPGVARIDPRRVLQTSKAWFRGRAMMEEQLNQHEVEIARIMDLLVDT